jgi:gluconokinase
MKSYFMAVDIGTSSVRAALFDGLGGQKGIASQEYPLICREAGMAELDPDEVFGAILKVVKECVDKSGVRSQAIEALGFSTQMHSFLAVDREGRCLTNVLTWADSRPMKQAEQISKEFDCMKLYTATGCRVQHPMYPLSKILWIREEKPGIFEKVYKFISIKQYVLFKLFSQFVVDYTDASASACFNIHSFKWDNEILTDILGISGEKLGEPVECTHVLKGMSRQYADAMGLRSDMPVVAGSGDGIMANLGCGVFDDTSMSCTARTDGA